TFTFGIPPNALTGIEDLFTCYCLHLGDRNRHVDADRFPLHVFRDAPESFDEPHSPLDLDFEEELSSLKSWLESKLERPIVLDIRERGELGDDLADVNVVIELSERLFRELKKHPDLVEELLMADVCPRFIRFYERRTRRHTRPSASRTNGSG